MTNQGNTKRQNRIPQALQMVFLASNRGKEVHKPPPSSLGSKVFFRNWFLQRKSNSKGNGMGTSSKNMSTDSSNSLGKNKPSSTGVSNLGKKFSSDTIASTYLSHSNVTIFLYRPSLPKSFLTACFAPEATPRSGTKLSSPRTTTKSLLIRRPVMMST